MPPKYTDLYVRAFEIAAKVLRKTSFGDEDEYVALLAELTKIRSDFEILMPLFWNHSTIHYVGHTPGILFRWGAFWAINMLAIERLHVLIKNLVRGTRNPMQSLQNHWYVTLCPFLADLRLLIY